MQRVQSDLILEEPRLDFHVVGQDVVRVLHTRLYPARSSRNAGIAKAKQLSDYKRHQLRADETLSCLAIIGGWLLHLVQVESLHVARRQRVGGVGS